MSAEDRRALAELCSELALWRQRLAFVGYGLLTQVAVLLAVALWRCDASALAPLGSLLAGAALTRIAHAWMGLTLRHHEERLRER